MSLAEEVAARKAQRRSLEEARQDRLDAEMRQRQDDLDAWAEAFYDLPGWAKRAKQRRIWHKLFGSWEARKAP